VEWWHGRVSTSALEGMRREGERGGAGGTSGVGT
jgi:hypothetical protein